MSTKLTQQRVDELKETLEHRIKIEHKSLSEAILGLDHYVERMMKTDDGDCDAALVQIGQIGRRIAALAKAKHAIAFLDSAAGKYDKSP